MSPDRRSRQLLIAACSAIALVPGTLTAGTEEDLFPPNWDRELALQTARFGTDEQQLQTWFAYLRNGENAILYRSLQNFSSAGVIPSPARERQLYLFTQALSDFPVESIPEEILGFLERYPARTLVPHEEHAGSGVPLFNIAAAAKGVRNAGFRESGDRLSETLIGQQPVQWVEAYLASDAASQRGFIDNLRRATPPELQAIGATALTRVPTEASLTAVAGTAALRLGDIEALETLVVQGQGAHLAEVLREAAQRLPEAGRGALLLAAIDEAPAENAALAIALLAPGSSGDAAITQSLFELLEHAELGSAAALALAHHPAPEVHAVTDAETARIIEWVENAPQADDTRIALGYPVPMPVDTPLPFDGFRSYAGLHARHQDLAATTPWVHAVAVGETRAGQTVWAYRMGDADLLTRHGLAEPATLTNGGIHAREWQTPEIVTGIMEMLVEGAEDQALNRYLLDNVNVLLIPVLNIDGFRQTQRYPDASWLGTDPSNPQFSPRDGRMRRKNMLGVDEDIATQEDHLGGVDLNRNNPPFWSTSPNNSSSDVRSLVHHGASAQSEPEIQALIAATALGPASKLSIYTDVHSFAQRLFWVRNGNNRLTQQTESVLRAFSNHHAGFPAGKLYGFNNAGSVVLNQGIGATDEYFTHTFQVPSWTLEVEPTDDGATDYGGLGRNGHDGFILPESQIRRVREELAQTFAVAYYRQAGPPAITAFRLVDEATQATVFEAEWDRTSDTSRALHAFQAQAVQLGRAYSAWIAFDKPMRWRENGAVVPLPGQLAATLESAVQVSVNGGTLNGNYGTRQWLDTPGGSPQGVPTMGYAQYRDDSAAFDFTLPADSHNLAAVPGSATATLHFRGQDMTNLRTDANPSTVARWMNGGWSGYENDAGADLTDTGGTDTTLQYTVTSANLGNPFVIEPGISSAWYDPERSGEGFVLEVLAGNRAVMYWFTYDEAGEQDWYIAVGDIEGNRMAFEELLQVSGGKFGPDFDPALVTEKVVGSASFIWSECDEGVMEWELQGDGSYRHGRMNLQRLTRLMGIDCGQVSLPPDLEEAYSSGSWYDPRHAGEGYTLELLTDERALAYWFSFDAGGKRRWFFGVGELVAGRFVFDEMLTTRGGVFGEAFDPQAVEELPWGSLELDLQCGSGSAHFQPSESGFPSGSLDLVRLTALDGLDC